MNRSSDDYRALAPPPNKFAIACLAACLVGVTLTVVVIIAAVRQHSAAKIGLRYACFSSQWSKTYQKVLTQKGFDDIVGRCPGGESAFYDRGSSPLQGKYEWYCASRNNYLQVRRPSASASLTVSGYWLASRPQTTMPLRQWVPGSFSRHVSFDAGFYPISDGQCYVDFADSKVGGGVFSYGLAQEEKLFLQLPELLLVVRERRMKRRPLYLSTVKYPSGRHDCDVLVFRDVMRPVGAVPKNVDMQCGWSPMSAQPCASFAEKQHAQPALVTIIAVNAEKFENDGVYSAAQFNFLADKILAAFGAAVANGCKTLNSGPLGAGVFHGNLDLATMLHAVMSIAFEIPIRMWGIQSQSSNVKDIVGQIEHHAMQVSAVLRRLHTGVTWGHGPKAKSYVHLHSSQWDRA